MEDGDRHGGEVGDRGGVLCHAIVFRLRLPRRIDRESAMSGFITLSFDVIASCRHINATEASTQDRSRTHVRTLCADRGQGRHRGAVRAARARGFSAALQHRADAADPAGDRRSAPRPRLQPARPPRAAGALGTDSRLGQEPGGAAAAVQCARRYGGRESLVQGGDAPSPRADPGVRLLRMAARRLEQAAALLGAAAARQADRLRRADGDLGRAGRFRDRHRRDPDHRAPMPRSATSTTACRW